MAGLWENAVTCPYCGSENTELIDDALEGDIWTSKRVCRDCGNDYIAVEEVVYIESHFIGYTDRHGHEIKGKEQR